MHKINKLLYIFTHFFEFVYMFQGLFSMASPLVHPFRVCAEILDVALRVVYHLLTMAPVPWFQQVTLVDSRSVSSRGSSSHLFLKCYRNMQTV